MAAVDGWVSDVDDVLSKAEHSYRQITEDTTTDEKRMLLADAKRLVRCMDVVSHVQLNEAKDNLDALSIQIKKLPREQQINYINVQNRGRSDGVEEDCVFGTNQGSAV